MDLGLDFDVVMGFPLRDPDPLFLIWKVIISQGFPKQSIAEALHDHLFADVERRAAGLCHVCSSGSIKVCLMFVQK
jgi:hypothetical protein